jgi:hypothetical protein
MNFSTAAGIAITILAPPVTSGIALWRLDQEYRSPSIREIYKSVRRVSMFEARRIALRALREAEDERLAFAEAEARRFSDGDGIDFNDL